MSLDIFNNNESAVRGYVRSFPTVFKRASGPHIYDENDKVFIDFFSGAGGLNYGHNHPALKTAMITYLENEGIIHGLDMATEAKGRFIELFQQYILAPRKLDYKLQFTGPTGTNAVEAALKLARMNTKRSGIVAFSHAFHGVSLGALATTANSWFRDAAGVELSNVTFIPYEGYVEGLDSITYLEKLITDPSSGVSVPAAVILETIQGEGGVNVASPQWLQRLRELTKKHNIILIVDDIQVGCGRTGNFFSFEESGIVPDMVTLSKSLSASGLPMSVLLISPEFDIWKPGQHNGTFRGNNLAFTSAAAAIEEFWQNDTFSNEVKRKATILGDQLQTIADNYPQLGLKVLGRGMVRGLICSSDLEFAGKISKAAFERGLIIETAGANDEVLKFLPSLNIDDDVLLEGISIVVKSIESLNS